MNFTILTEQNKRHEIRREWREREPDEFIRLLKSQLADASVTSAVRIAHLQDELKVAKRQQKFESSGSSAGGGGVT